MNENRLDEIDNHGIPEDIRRTEVLEITRLARIGLWADESAHAAMCFVLDKLNCAVLETNKPLSLSSLAKLKARIEESLDAYPEEFK